METIIGKSYLTKIPHEGGELAFQYPAFNGTCENITEQIDKAGLKRPSSVETASLVYEAWKNPEEKDSLEIISILRDNWFWEFTGNLYLPKSDEEINNGVILETNPKIENGELIMDKSSLIKRLKENDPLVKFVPFGFKIETQSSLELSKNPYIIARYGEEGAEKIAKVADEYSNNPYLWSFISVDEEKIKMSALNRYRGSGNGLFVDGIGWDDGDRGHAFGVCKK